MDPVAEPLSFFGSQADCAPLDWEWVDKQLQQAGTYWVVARSDGLPHPRPVWGIWHDRHVLLSVGSEVVSRQLGVAPEMTLHLDSGTDVVIVDGRVTGASSDAAAIRAYDTKYDWTYTVDEYGPLTVVAPTIVRAWRSAGWAGRDGFQSAGRWRFV